MTTNLKQRLLAHRDVARRLVLDRLAELAKRRRRRRRKRRVRPGDDDSVPTRATRARTTAVPRERQPRAPQAGAGEPNVGRGPGNRNTGTENTGNGYPRASKTDTEHGKRKTTENWKWNTEHGTRNTRRAWPNLSVETVSSWWIGAAVAVQRIAVSALPPSDCLSSRVSFESRYGTTALVVCVARAASPSLEMTRPSTSSDLLMFEPSASRLPVAPVPFCRSEPARSTYAAGASERARAFISCCTSVVGHQLLDVSYWTSVVVHSAVYFVVCPLYVQSYVDLYIHLYACTRAALDPVCAHDTTAHSAGGLGDRGAQRQRRDPAATGFVVCRASRALLGCGWRWGA